MRALVKILRSNGILQMRDHQGVRVYRIVTTHGLGIVSLALAALIKIWLGLLTPLSFTRLIHHSPSPSSHLQICAGPEYRSDDGLSGVR